MKDNRLKPNYEIRRKPEANLRNYYTILLETGLILALIILIVLARVDFRTAETEIILVSEQEVVEMEEIVQTQQDRTPPPPPRQPVPVAVPNHEIIEDVDIMIDAEMDLGGFLDMPPPPPQEESEEPEEDFFILVEQMPELIGGLEALQRQVRYPERALRAQIQGRVYVQFIVNERGEVENPRVVRGIGGGADEEALRVVSQAKFVPGMQRGRPVRVQYSLPVIFMIRN
ncbi:MAG: energy transducer TonB [Balneolaceae bacterium]|nr:MAG: energy transducer TonB [Balneolaceae bacterium]